MVGEVALVVVVVAMVALRVAGYPAAVGFLGVWENYQTVVVLHPQFAPSTV
jgi:hypothetical protein